MAENNTQTHELRRFLLPSWFNIGAYTLMAVVVLVTVNAQKLWNDLFNGALKSQDVTAVDPSQIVEQSKYQSAIGTISVLLFWAAVASAVYMLIWLTQNSLSEVKREVGSQQISGDMVKRRYLDSVLAHYAFFIALTAVTLISLFFTFLYVLPVVGSAFYGVSVNLGQFSIMNILLGLGCIFVLMVVIHALKLLMQIYTRFWRMYIKAQ